MSEEKLIVTKWRYNPEKEMVELLVEQGEGREPFAITLPEQTVIEMSDMIPSLEEEKMVRELLKKIYEVREREIMAIEAINKELEALRGKHEDLRKRLSVKGITKNEILALAAESKDLAIEKALLDSKRHLCKLLSIEESDLRAKLAKILAGRGIG